VRVRVPFGGRRVVGVCVRLASSASLPEPAGAPQEPALFEGAPVATAARRALKDIEKALDREPALTPALLELTRFVAEYYRCSWGEAIQAALPGSVKRRIRKHAAAEREVAARIAPADAPSSTPDLAPATAPSPGAPPPALVLTPGQRDALDQILEPIRARTFAVTLVHGVTGSGKTEVYLRAIDETLRLGRCAILLVPEISLTPQTVARIRARFGDVGLLHSLQSDAERARHWERIRRGEVRVVVGPRSAVFAPVPNLGLIVVDEEHDASFKQDSVPRYHARDVAIVRARAEQAVAILGSATPSIESHVNAREGRYRGVYLPDRATRARLPDVEVVDLREEVKAVKGFPFISRRLEQVLKPALERGEQAILFLNRRGFSTFLQCKRCRHVLTCRECDVALTFHKANRLAVCHYCEAERPPPSECPKCLAPEVHYFGFGTERIEEEVARRFPGVRVQRVDSDAIEDAATLERVLEAFGRGEVQVLIGTQMVSKGLDFARVTVVGIISADTALNLPDFRSSERTFQLIAQVTGRAGRADLGGISIVQTFCPEHAAIRAARSHDSLGFLEHEIAHRRKLGYPPFARLARIVVSGPDESETARAAETIAGAMRAAPDTAEPEPAAILGPAPAPLSVLRGRYRFMILLKARNRSSLKPMLEAAETCRLPTKVRMAIDVDPASML
jgi:primosomal protein N' (replication factor Y)